MNMLDSSVVDEMYSEYESGLSLAQIGVLLGRTRQAVYAMFRRRGLPLRGQTKLEPQIFRGNSYTINNMGYYRKTGGKRNLMHRDVWTHYNGAIPNNYDIHHKDRDKTNNEIKNLELIRKDEHARRYSTGNNQFTKKNNGAF